MLGLRQRFLNTRRTTRWAPSLGWLLRSPSTRASAAQMSSVWAANTFGMERWKFAKKTRAVLEIPLHDDLQKIIEATPGEHLTFLTTKTGKSYAPNDLSDEFRGSGLPHCSIHGLRKAAARRLAEARCSAHEIAAITGHKTLKEVDATPGRLSKRGWQGKR